jgi:hypothetical protein
MARGDLQNSFFDAPKVEGTGALRQPGTRAIRPNFRDYRIVGPLRGRRTYGVVPDTIR